MQSSASRNDDCYSFAIELKAAGNDRLLFKPKLMFEARHGGACLSSAGPVKGSVPAKFLISTHDGIFEVLVYVGDTMLLGPVPRLHVERTTALANWRFGT